MNNDFKDFIDAYLDKFLENQSKEISNQFNSNTKAEIPEIVGRSISVCNTSMLDFISAYHFWLTENYDLHKK